MKEPVTGPEAGEKGVDLHYDGAGPKGWLACLATSKDLVNWTKHEPVLDFGAQGSLQRDGARCLRRR